jgi:DsbC/DsbD-like thiol-disulfide interchange protein
MTPRFALHHAAIAVVALICLPAAAPAQDASAWNAEQHAATRIIAGATLKAGDMNWLRAGIEIKLEPGWKTYWRYPGDSGVPPTLDFTGSGNVKSVMVLWPAPELFDDGGGGHSIGYHSDVVLPLRIVAADPSRPSSLRVKLTYAVCGRLCVPGEANLALELSGKVAAEEPVLAAAEARVPRRVVSGPRETQGKMLAIRAVHREGDGAKGKVVVDVAAPTDMPVDLLVEGPTPDWALPLPTPANPVDGGSPGVRRFTFNLDGLPPGAHADGAILTFTAVSPADAIEVRDRLD